MIYFSILRFIFTFIMTKALKIEVIALKLLFSAFLVAEIVFQDRI